MTKIDIFLVNDTVNTVNDTDRYINIFSKREKEMSLPSEGNLHISPPYCSATIQPLY
jgi:hypothetical protein